MQNQIPDLNEIIATVKRIAPFIHRTPVLCNQTIDRISGAKIFFKCENFQKMGAFKMRGASNAVAQITDAQKSKGVTTHSSGNFAQALALAARNFGIKAFIVMPENAPDTKRQAVLDYGAQVITCASTQKAREEKVEEVIAKTGAIFIHPYNDYRVIAGQATAAKELLEDVNDLDFILAPVGGGGLISGTALATTYLSPKTKVIAAEPSNADDAYRSIKAGEILPSINPDTIADGLRTSLGDKTFPIIQKFVHQIICVEEQEIIYAMKLIWERMKIIVEPSGVVPLAVVLKNHELFSGKKIGIILSGGNLDLTKLPF